MINKADFCTGMSGTCTWSVQCTRVLAVLCCCSEILRQLYLYIGIIDLIFKINNKGKFVSFYKLNLIDRVTIYDGSLTDFLEKFDGKISKFILLDHMDWMSYKAKSKLEYQWQLILKRSTNNSRLIFRSADKWPGYLDEILIDENGNRLMEVLKFQRDLSDELSRFDRVHTYAGFHIAEITGDIECLRMT